MLVDNRNDSSSINVSMFGCPPSKNSNFYTTSIYLTYKFIPKYCNLLRDLLFLGMKKPRNHGG